MRSSPQASGVKLPKNASKPPPSRLCSHLASQFSHNAPPSHCDETKGWIAKNGTSVNGRYIHPTHRGGFYHGPPRDPSKSFQVLGPLGWQTQTSSPNMATTLQPLEPCRSFELRKGTKKKTAMLQTAIFFRWKLLSLSWKGQVDFFCWETNSWWNDRWTYLDTVKIVSKFTCKLQLFRNILGVGIPLTYHSHNRCFNWCLLNWFLGSNSTWGFEFRPWPFFRKHCWFVKKQHDNLKLTLMGRHWAFQPHIWVWFSLCIMLFMSNGRSDCENSRSTNVMCPDNTSFLYEQMSFLMWMLFAKRISWIKAIW